MPFCLSFLPGTFLLRKMFSQQRRYCTDSVIFSQSSCCTHMGTHIRLVSYTSTWFSCERDPKHLCKCGKLKQPVDTWLAKYSSVLIMFISGLCDTGCHPVSVGFFPLPSLPILLTSSPNSSIPRLSPPQLGLNHHYSLCTFS